MVLLIFICASVKRKAQDIEKYLKKVTSKRTNIAFSPENRKIGTNFQKILSCGY